MQLEKVTAEIRPRGRWESIDLGCALVRENYSKVLAAWCLTAFPLWFVIIALCQLLPSAEGAAWLAGFLCWWLLPFSDRVPLFVLSRRLFGEDSHWSELLKALPRLFTRRLIFTLLLGPFDLGRGLSQPVMALEGLKGKPYRERVNLLSRNGGEGASQASLVAFILVLATMVSALFLFFSLLGLFGDEVVLDEFWVDYVLGSDAVVLEAPFVWLIVGLMLLSISLVEPFYVGAGFAIYINSRTVTEGWDIELAFKRMNERVKSVLSGSGKFIAVFLTCCLLSHEAGASNERLEQVMAHEDFVVHTEMVEVPVPSSSGWDWPGFNLGWVGVLGHFIFWAVLAAIVAALVWLIYSNRHVFRVGKSGSKATKRTEGVRTVMGMDISPESLPNDIVRSAREAWDAGDYQIAMSFLYRGAIAELVRDHDIAITDSSTEMDCLQAVRAEGNTQSTDYFSRLTQMWMGLAYGSEKPSENEVVWLLGNWPYSQEVTS